MLRIRTALVLGMALATSAAAREPVPRESGAIAPFLSRWPRARNVVFLVPDGLGLSDVTAARVRKHGPAGAPLALETLAFVGYERNHSVDSLVTDSAAAASAWSCGEKFRNGSICIREDGSSPSSLLELARDRGRRTGLVATSTITHATPAAFGAHVADRGCETEIARQYVEVTGVDVLLGGGRSTFRPSSPDACGAGGDQIAGAAQRGYRVASDREGLDAAVATRARKVLGLFADGAMSPAAAWTPASPEPSLPQMAAAALDLLDDAPAGFFLMIEGSQIDWANHANDAESQLAEVLAFDDAVRVVLDWASASPARLRQTLIVVAPDHETGGFSIVGPEGTLPGPGEPLQVAWTTGGHTGGDVPVWSQGPLAWRLARPMDNTDVFAVIRDALR